MKVQVDGDIITFRAGFGAEYMEYDVIYKDPAFEDPVTIVARYKKDADAVVAELEKSGHVAAISKRRVLEPLAHALHNVGTLMTNILEKCGAGQDDLTTWLSGPSEDNFRKKIATIKPYKGNRKDAWRPTYENEIREYIIRKWNGVVTKGQEADDAMGIAQCALPYGSSVIVTIDKDLDMIPGLHYNFVTNTKYVVDDQTAAWLFWKQMLTGDTTDNIPGCPGIGEKKAEAALQEVWDDEEAMRMVVWTLYVQGYGYAAYPALLENAGLLWIRRKEGQLWHP